MYELVDIQEVYPDESNPRKPDPVRLHLLRLSLSKLGFLLPIAVTEDGMVLSGHQRLTVARELGWETVPVHRVSLSEKDVAGINILFNRATNDFGALDTGTSATESLHLSDIISDAEELPDFKGRWFAMDCKIEDIRGLGTEIADKYDKKAVVVAENFIRKEIRIPIVVSESGDIVNGVHRLFAARENGVTEWPIIRIPDELAEFALHFLNYLSMDYKVDSEFADMLRAYAYRRPQNNRGSVPKAYRFWANGKRTLLDKDSYTTDYWRKFRDIHGHTLLDFGAGLGKVAPFLQEKGFDCMDFEPYRINPRGASGKPDSGYSRRRARDFLEDIAGRDVHFDSIFLASVLNSIPFPEDRMAVLAVCHGLCNFDTVVYGTCRDISDFHYEYGGIRQANYFVFDSEPGVRLGDALHSPKIQKFHSPKEFKQLGQLLWKTVDIWPGGNVFYWRLKNPKRVNPKVLRQAIEIEFDLPYADGTRMGLVDKAIEAFTDRGML